MVCFDWSGITLFKDMDFLTNQECSILPPTPGDSNRVERVRQRSKAEKFTWFAQNVKYVLIFRPI